MKNCKNYLEELDKLEESSKSVAIRTNGLGILKYIQMIKEKTKGMLYCLMKILRLRTLLEVFITIMI